MTGGKCHGRTMMDGEGGEAYLMNADPRYIYIEDTGIGTMELVHI